MIDAKAALELSNNFANLSSYGVTEFSRIESLIIDEAKSGGKSIRITLATYDGKGNHRTLIEDQLVKLGYTVKTQGDEHIVYWDQA